MHLIKDEKDVNFVFSLGMKVYILNMIIYFKRECYILHWGEKKGN